MALLYSTYLSGSDNDVNRHSLAVDNQGRADVAATTPGAFDSTYSGGASDSFVAKLSKRGSRLLYSTYLGGTAPDHGWDAALDHKNAVIVSGSTESSNFPTTPEAFQRLDPFPTRELFLTKLELDRGER